MERASPIKVGGTPISGPPDLEQDRAGRGTRSSSPVLSTAMCRRLYDQGRASRGPRSASAADRDQMHLGVIPPESRRGIAVDGGHTSSRLASRPVLRPQRHTRAYEDLTDWRRGAAIVICQLINRGPMVVGLDDRPSVLAKPRFDIWPAHSSSIAGVRAESRLCTSTFSIRPHSRLGTTTHLCSGTLLPRRLSLWTPR